MTKNLNSGLFIFSFFVFEVGCGGGGGGAGGGGEKGLARQGEVLAREWAQLFSYVPNCINLIHIAFRFHEDVS